MINHLISVDQFDTDCINDLFVYAARCETGGGIPLLPKGIVSTNLFYEPSTRTSSSFYSAMAKLGGSVIPINDVNYSSVSKGETLEDTIRTVACYSDVIVLRHPIVGSVARAAAVSPVPVINAGDGVGEHPTQALLDLYTIRKHKGLNGHIRIALVGDLKHGRTVHSLLKLLRLYNVEMHLVSPKELAMPNEYVKDGDLIHETLDECIADVDVVYMTRVQKERITTQEIVGNYALTLDHMAKAKKDMIVMHPLPRVDELPTTIDSDPRAVYFDQIKNGLYVRQAIFLRIFGSAAAFVGSKMPPWKNWVLT